MALHGDVHGCHVLWQRFPNAFRARGRLMGQASRPDLCVLQPHLRNDCFLDTEMVWAEPGSFATTTGLVPSSSGYVRCFSSPGSLHRSGAAGWQRVAPFGDRGIIACSPLPHAYRCDATSFIGTQRQGIHRMLIMSSLHVPLTEVDDGWESSHPQS